MKVSRRDFIHAGCLATAVTLSTPIVDQAEAFWKGLAIVGQKTIVNLNSGKLAYLNIAKGFSLKSSQAGWQGLIDANGYPSGTLTQTISDVLSLDDTYYGRYYIYWLGTGCLQFNPQAIVYSGGASVTGVSPSASGSTAFNFTIGLTGQPRLATPVEFAFGCLISGIADNGAGLVRLTSTLSNAFSNIATGSVYSINNITNLSAGPWTITKIDANHIDLQGSTYNVTMAVVGGSPGTASEAILGMTANVSYLFLTSGTYSSWITLVWCEKPDAAAAAAGEMVSPKLVSALAPLRPKVVRVMDVCAVQHIAGEKFADRTLPSTLSWKTTTRPVQAYWGGIATNGGADDFTCSNPSGSPAGAFVDGEVIIAQIGATSANVGFNPTLNPGARGAKPIYNSNLSLLGLSMTGTVPPTGTTISLVFTGGGLASPFTYIYLTSTSVNGPGARLDDSFANITVNIRADIQNNTRGNAGALVAAGITCLNTNGSLGTMSFSANRNAPTLDTGFTATGSDSALSATYGFGRVAAAQLANNTICAFTYSTLLGGWISKVGGTTAGGVRGGPPLEFYAELCGKVGCGLWYNIGLLSQQADITGIVTTFANATWNGQPAIKTLCLELANEMWNAIQSQWPPCYNLGNALGLFSTSQGQYGFSGLRIAQMAKLASDAWVAAGRSRSDLKIVNAYAFSQFNALGTSQASKYQFNGQDLNASGSGTNATLKAYGAMPNGSSAPTAITTDFSAAPTRPIDWSDWISPAPYWQGHSYNAYGPDGRIPTSGLTAADYSGLLTASNNYVNGNAAQKAAALDFLYSGGMAGAGDLYDGPATNSGEQARRLRAWANGSGVSGAQSYFGCGIVAASYDISRSTTGTSGGAQLTLGVACYEGGLSTGPVTANETSLWATDLTTLGDNSISFGGTGVPATDAANITTLFAAFKNDSRYYDLTLRYCTEFVAAARVTSTREAYPAWYGFEGPNDFALYPGSIKTTPFQSYNAFAAF
jgi:hypothetical protein